MTCPEMELRRVVQAPPTTKGWYYGRLINNVEIDPAPLWVEKLPFGSYLVVEVIQSGRIHSTTDFAWFGPVPTCVEASLPV